MTPANARHALAFAAALALASPAAAQGLSADGGEALGTYGGSYVCADGEHGFYLDIATVAPADSGGFAVTGTLGFFPVVAGLGGGAGTVAGSFAVGGTLSAEGMMTLQPGAWLVQPAGYGAAHLDATLSQRDDGLWQIAGRPLVPGNEAYCTELIAVRFLP